MWKIHFVSPMGMVRSTLMESASALSDIHKYVHIPH